MIRHLNPKLAIHQKLLLATPPLTLFAISYWINSPMYGAWFGIIDDHFYISQLVPGNELKLWQIPRELLETELGSFGNTTRYRPTYWILQFTQTYIFGDSAGARYLLRSLSQAMSSFLIYKICLLRFSNAIVVGYFANFERQLIALTVAFSSMGLLSWGDITLRLGPSEADLVLGICISTYAAFLIIYEGEVGANNQSKKFSLLCIGVLIASGSKENGILAYLLLLYITIFYTRRQLAHSITNTILFAITSFQVLGVTINSLLVFGSGADVYLNERSPSLMVSTLLDHIRSENFILLALTTCLMFFIFKIAPSAHTKAHCVIVLFFFFINISENIFYRGNLQPLRYAILTQISYLVSFGILVINILKIVYEKYNKNKINFHLLTAVCTIIIAFVWSPEKNLQTLRETALENSEMTLIWRNELDELAANISENPSYQVVFYQFNAMNDYERIFSTIKFLRYHKVENPIFLKINSASYEDKTLDKALLETLKSISKSGSSGWEIDPISNLKVNANIYCISFGVDLEDSQLYDHAEIARSCRGIKSITS